MTKCCPYFSSERFGWFSGIRFPCCSGFDGYTWLCILFVPVVSNFPLNICTVTINFHWAIILYLARICYVSSTVFMWKVTLYNIIDCVRMHISKAAYIFYILYIQQQSFICFTFRWPANRFFLLRYRFLLILHTQKEKELCLNCNLTSFYFITAHTNLIQDSRKR